MLSLYSACNRKWAFKYLRGWKVPGDLYGPLAYGHAIHEAQAAMYATRSVKAAHDMINKLAPWKDHKDEMKRLFRKKLDIGFEKWYTEIGENDLKNLSIILVEKELPLRLPNGYTMTVRVDRILRDPSNNEIFINDTKTTGWSFDGTQSKYMIHDQPRLYIAAVRQNYPEWTEALTGWRTDLIYIKRASRSPGGFSCRVGRSDVISFTDAEIEDTLISYAGLTDDIAGKLQATETEPLASLFPANYGNCDAYNRICEYHSICPMIDRQEEPPADLELDSWLADGIVLNSFKEL